MEDNTNQVKKISFTLTAEDQPVSMLSWGDQAVKNYESVYNRKTSEKKDEQAAIWTSMYEKNLGRKVSDLPPWIEPEKAEKKYGDPEKTDLASVHMMRAAESGAAHSHPIITATERRHHRKHKKRSGSGSSVTSGEDEEGNLKDKIADFHERIAQGDDMDMGEH